MTMPSDQSDPSPDRSRTVPEETLAALRAMNDNIVRLTAALEGVQLNDNIVRPTTIPGDRQMPNGHACLAQDAPHRQPRPASPTQSNDSVSNGTGNDDRDLDRSTIRLDGLEVYAVVAALTTATSIACFDAFSAGEWDALWSSGQYLALVKDMAFLMSSVAGIVAGMHATLAFSLMTMYGRTALGMDRDDAFVAFFARTGRQRYRGFRTFLFSLYAFLLQVVLLVASKSPRAIQVPAFLGVATWCLRVYWDAEEIIDAAGIIFAPPPARGEGGGSNGDSGGAAERRRPSLQRRPSLLVPPARGESLLRQGSLVFFNSIRNGSIRELDEDIAHNGDDPKND